MPPETQRAMDLLRRSTHPDADKTWTRRQIEALAEQLERRTQEEASAD
jgi:hypothetical protein